MTHAIISADVVHYLRGNRWLVQNGYLPKYHAVLCDPPYSLPGGFMSKDWDHFDTPEHFQAWVTEWAELLLDYVYPGALLVAFGGTRTYHRLAAGLEDAGWTIADSMMWVYASGFPKSAAIDKLLDKEAGATREDAIRGGHKGMHSRTDGATEQHRTLRDTFGPQVNLGALTRGTPATPLAARWQGWGTALKPSFEPAVIARAPRGKRTYAGLAREFGTGALAIDAGRIGTNGEHVSVGMADSKRRGVNGMDEGWKRPWMEDGEYHAGKIEAAMDRLNTMGRWPANFGLVCTCESDDHAADCPVAVLGEQTSERTSKASGGGYAGSVRHLSFGLNSYQTNMPDDSGGSAARFFYTAKASAWEREAGLHDRARRVVNITEGHGRGPINTSKKSDDGIRTNNPRANVHPTVKPIRLAEYLARLILPPELDEPRRLLIPFAGSGSEMIGALLAGWDVVTGIEREAEYVDLARARVGWWAQFGTYDEARKAWDKAKREKPAPIVLPVEDKPAQLGLFGEETA